MAVCVAAAGMSAAFPVGAPAYDGYLPEQVAAVGISVDGINMDYDTYLEVSRKNECYEADSQMEKYTLSSEGKTAVMGWLRTVAEQRRTSEGVYLCGCVLFDRDGSSHYRSYPVSREAVEAFCRCL